MGYVSFIGPQLLGFVHPGGGSDGLPSINHRVVGKWSEEVRDGNSGMGIRYLSGIRFEGMGTGTIFYP
jgi:hypothetical protein